MKKGKRPVKEVMMRVGLVTASAMLLVAGTVLAKDKNYPKAKVSFNDFKSLVVSVEVHREQRLVDLRAPNTMPVPACDDKSGYILF